MSKSSKAAIDKVTAQILQWSGEYLSERKVRAVIEATLCEQTVTIERLEKALSEIGDAATWVICDPSSIHLSEQSKQFLKSMRRDNENIYNDLRKQLSEQTATTQAMERAVSIINGSRNRMANALNAICSNARFTTEQITNAQSDFDEFWDADKLATTAFEQARWTPTLAQQSATIERLSDALKAVEREHEVFGWGYEETHNKVIAALYPQLDEKEST